MTTRGRRLVFAMSAVGVLSCSEINGKAMTQSEGGCRNVPTIEECQYTAKNLITDEYLRKCVIDQCALGAVVCAAETPAECSRLTREHPKGVDTAGYVVPREQTCHTPIPAVHWCQRDLDPRCQQLSMVHEEAHACCWEHLQGKGVPGNEGEIRGCNFSDH